jgi:hypothetical protein
MTIGYMHLLTVADVTNNNPNLFYELGITHTHGKKVVIICHKVPV